MDQRIESFLADVLALADENTNAVRAGVRDALADCEAIFRAQQTNKRMRDNAARVSRALCRSRVVAAMRTPNVILRTLACSKSRFRRLATSRWGKWCRFA
jgi:hypothetical protein